MARLEWRRGSEIHQRLPIIVRAINVQNLDGPLTGTLFASHAGPRRWRPHRIVAEHVARPRAELRHVQLQQIALRGVVRRYVERFSITSAAIYNHRHCCTLYTCNASSISVAAINNKQKICKKKNKR
jgi:hypothetical protein